jgi:hypothetical protein
LIRYFLTTPMDFKNYIHQEYKWPNIPNEEIERLSNVLSIHLRKMKLKKTKEERIEIVKNILIKQKGTCAFADGDSRFCWNEPKDRKLIFLKLQWGHKLPRSHGGKAYELDNLILLCARCNNNIQKSRTIEQLIPELEHKLKAIKKL